MRYKITTSVLVAAGTVLAACGTTAQQSAPEGTATVEEFAAQLGRDYHADYTPLASPRQAVEKSDLIVRGTVEEVFDGISTSYPDKQRSARSAGSYVTFRVSVDQVLSGPDAQIQGGAVYVQVAKAQSTPTEAVAKANPKPSAVLVLDDITDWKPAPDATVHRPARLPDGARLYFAFTDGLWLQGAGDRAMVGTAAHREDLAPDWGSPTGLDDLARAIENAR
ncbi:hypothetical protein [Saccharothrix coeruleofusca]|uniref:Lipoprotein LprG n=1 Tax=Saccharothrix coeruleofusca TaxID=33919 RepID=A0A918ANP6_9PSEU|nr:hypothetical protein [Saccharothrix coeruleofusca]GGP63676.1 hypothetical protein GCM10010185_40480 [Saccharothrix coeruleofusca]